MILTSVCLSLALTTPPAQDCGAKVAQSCSSSATLASATAGSATAGSDIVDTAVSAGSFETLVAAVKAAGLVDALKGEGPFTVFAPSDEAFAKLPEGTIANLLKPENKETLRTILTYHVVPGKVTAKDVTKLRFAGALNGQRIDIAVEEGSVSVEDARVVKTDIECSNGVIHVIDRVILPNTKDIIGTAVEAGSFGTLAAALKAASLVEALQGEGPFTVFAPTDEAFAKLPEGTVANLLKPENKEKLAAILKLHVIPGRVYSDVAAKGATVASLQGGKLTTKSEKGEVFVNGARVVQADLDTTNGVIHVIDRVILPE